MGLAESQAAQHVKADFAAQLITGHEIGFVDRDSATLSLRALGSPRHT
jgi:hypothetical protein